MQPSFPQDRRDRRVCQASQVDLDLQDSLEDLVSQEPKGNRVLLGLVHLDHLESR